MTDAEIAALARSGALQAAPKLEMDAALFDHPEIESVVQKHQLPPKKTLALQVSIGNQYLDSES